MAFPEGQNSKSALRNFRVRKTIYAIPSDYFVVGLRSTTAVAEVEHAWHELENVCACREDGACEISQIAQLAVDSGLLTVHGGVP
jgi:hypothetical protein